MDKEFRRISELLKNRVEREEDGRKYVTGEIGSCELVLHQCGIGKVNAAIGTAELIRRFSPTLVISTGCAGGGRTDMEVMDVVVSTEIAYHDVYCGEAMGHSVYGQVQGMPVRFSSPKLLVEKAIEVSPRVHAGLIVTGDWFVDTKEKMREIMGHFPEAQAVDMESCGIAQTCHIYGVPFVSMRIISDVPLRDDKAAMYVDFWDRLANNSFGVTRRFLDNIR